MTPLRDLAPDWPLLSPLLDEALELPASERESWLKSLASRTGTHSELPALVRSLLDAAGRAETTDFMRTMVPLAGAATLGEPGPGDVVGPWRLQRAVGAGGMGTVWTAERADGSLKRLVALKLPRLAWGDALWPRVARERDILSRLEHEHIARLYDAGVDALGRPWLALEYVEGVSITAYAARHALDNRARIGLLLQVCEALAFAHERLVIHRDLKPANILVSTDGVVKLLDFGIAQLIEGDTPTAATQWTARALTPDYASPEQLRREPLGTTSDVYSLGVVAYELLAGASPYVPRRGSVAALEESIEHEDPPPASRRATDPAAGRALRGDLDAILAKALAKRPVDRYAGVVPFADDLRRHLAHEAVHARPPSIGYRLWRLLRRHRLAVAAGVTAVSALLAGSAFALRQATRADAQAVRAEAVRDFMVDLFRTAGTSQRDARQMRALTAPELIERGVNRIGQLESRHPEAQIELLDVFASVLLQNGEARRAAKLWRDAFARARAQWGDDASDTLWMRVNLAHSLATIGRFDEARAELAAARERLQRVAPASLPMAHAWVRTALLESRTNPALALQAAQQGVTLLQQLATRPSPANRESAWIEDNLAHGQRAWGNALNSAGRYDEALVQLGAAREALVRLYGNDCADIEDVLSGEVEAHAGRDDIGRALMVSLDLLQRVRSRGDTARVSDWRATLQRARLLLAAGRPAEAAAVAREGLASREALPDRLISPRTSSFEGVAAAAELRSPQAAAARRTLESLLAGNEGSPSLRAEWLTALATADLVDRQTDTARQRVIEARRLLQSYPGSLHLHRQLQDVESRLRMSPGP